MSHLPAHLAKPRGTPHTHLVFGSAISPVGTPLSVDWRQFNYLMQVAGHEKVANKLHAKLITPWTPNSGATSRRTDAFGYTTMLVFDLDKIATTDIDDVISWCDGNEVLVHTTFSHGVDGLGCFRVYMVLDEPVGADDYRRLHTAVLATTPDLAKHVDPTCGDPVRCYFMPSCPPERHHLAEIHPSFGGQGVEVARFLTPAETTAPGSQAAPAGLLTQSQGIAALMPPPVLQGQRNQALVTLAARAFAKGYTPEALMPYAQEWAQECNPRMNPVEVAATVNSMWNTHTRNHPQANLPHAVQDPSPTGQYLLTATQLMALPLLAWLIRGVIPERGLCAIYGPSGSGKTFLALDLALAVACLKKWFGEPVKNAPVVYVALEGEAGVSQRMKAWEKFHGRQAPAQLRFVIRPVSLMAPGECEALAAEIVATVGKGTVIFIDTLNRAAPTADENTSGDMGRVIQSAKSLADAVDGLVILVHHSGKNVSQGLRGHSSLLAAMDAVIEVSRSAIGREWSITKSKDSADGIKHGFELSLVKLGEDAWGMELTSCAIEAATPGRVAPTKPLRGEKQKKAYDALSKLLGDAQASPLGVATRATAETAVTQVLDCEPKRKPERARALVTSLLVAGHFIESNGHISKH